MKPNNVHRNSKEFSAAVGRALRRAAKVPRKAARMHGTPIYIWKNGKVVAEKPRWKTNRANLASFEEVKNGHGRLSPSTTKVYKHIS
jgi:hypothetical protein